MSTLSEQPAEVPGKAPEHVRRAILQDARPLPPVEETMIAELTDDEARIFLETITDAWARAALARSSWIPGYSVPAYRRALKHSNWRIDRYWAGVFKNVSGLDLLTKLDR